MPIKWTTWKKLEKFLERYSLLRLNQEETENMKWAITRTEIETVIKNPPTNKSPGPDGFTGELYQTLRKELTPTFLKLFQKTTGKGILLCSPSPEYQNQKKILHTHTHTHTHTHKWKLQAYITYKHRCKNSYKTTSKQNPTTYYEDYTPWSSGIYPKNAKILHESDTNTNWKIKIMIITIDAEKAFDKIQQIFMIKTLEKLGIYLSIYNKPTQTSFSMVKIWKHFL